MSEVKRIYAHPDSTDVVLPGEAAYGDPGVLQNYMELVPAKDYDALMEAGDALARVVSEAPAPDDSNIGWWLEWRLIPALYAWREATSGENGDT